MSALAVLIALIAVLSLVACSTVVVQYASAKFRCSVLLQPKAMVLFLAAADSALALLTIIEAVLVPGTNCASADGDGSPTRVSCLGLSFAHQAATLSSFFWTAALCHSSFHSISEQFSAWTRMASHVRSGSSGLGGHHNEEARAMIKYHALCWCMPIALSLLKIVTGSCTNADGARCGMLPDASAGLRSGWFWVTMIGFLVPIYAVTLFVVAVLIYLAVQIRRMSLNNSFTSRFQRCVSCSHMGSNCH
jgi:hypothetical protein